MRERNEAATSITTRVVLATGGCAGDGDRFLFTVWVRTIFYRRYSVKSAQITRDSYRWKMQPWRELIPCSEAIFNVRVITSWPLYWRRVTSANRAKCVIVQWTGNNGVWDTIPAKEADRIQPV